MISKVFSILILLLGITITNAQTCTTLIAHDYVEEYDWTGLWFGNTLSSGYYNNASVSATLSAAVYGNGAGTSAIEQDWYVLPNRTGLNPAYTYLFKFRLGSYVFTNTTATTRGVDAPDLVEVQVSTNGEVSYTSEIRITGNANATWNYNTAGVINKTANGVLTTYTPAAGGNRTATGDGYSDITLTITGISQIAIDILCRVNAAGEEWWLDNMELYEIGPCAPLPIQLSYFNGTYVNHYNQLNWKSLTETNNSHYIIDHSTDGMLWNSIGTAQGAGNSLLEQYYTFKHYEFSDSYNYYKLTQYDFNGDSQTFDIVMIDNRSLRTHKLLKATDLLGRDVSYDYNGVKLIFYDDGTYEKVFIVK